MKELKYYTCQFYTGKGEKISQEVFSVIVAAFSRKQARILAWQEFSSIVCKYNMQINGGCIYLKVNK